ncbi:MAG: amidohydrolase family protein [Armatimonadetes bacterium]|nr:amidohydrolase family protein [Armatimonadota bacterium]
MILSARWVLPLSAPPLLRGAVRICGDRIEAVGPLPRLLEESDGDSHLDLGNAILLPGLVNAHCHLDYTYLRAVGPDLDFPDWILELTRRKNTCAPDDFLNAARDGARECLRGGITTVADCTDSAHAAQALHEIGIRGISFPEVFGVDDRDPMEASLERLRQKEERLQPWLSDRVMPGISPHAPYSVRATLFEHLNRRSQDERLPLMIHLAESDDEVRALLGKQPWKSPIREGFVQWTAPGERPVAYMERLGLLRPGVTFIHCVQVTHEEIGRLAGSGAGVVTCPRSNAYLRTGIARLREMLDAGVKLGIGTDGACSSGPLSIFEEMRAAWLIQRSTGSPMTTRELVEMATHGGAKALGMEDQIGSLEPGKLADLTALSLDHPTTQGCEDPYDALVLCGSSESVLFTMVGGQAVWDPNRLFAGPCHAYSATEK